MNYADIKQYDISNGPGVRISLFVSGCTHRCKNCFNEEAWDFNYGKPFTGENMDQILEYLAPDYIWGLTLLGGEPFERSNQQGLLPLLRKVRERYPNKTIWFFLTGILWAGWSWTGRRLKKCFPILMFSLTGNSWRKRRI